MKSWNLCKTLAALLFCTLCCSCQKSVEQTDSEQIPILGWYGVAPEESTVERYRELKESGITHNFTFFQNVEELAAAMEAAKEAGIKVIAHCPELEKEPEKIVNRFKDHPATAGYFLRDEPDRSAFAGLGEWAQRIQAVDNRHFCYLNLFPNYASPEMLGTATYREYVQEFIREVPLQLLSFDHYPVIEDASGERRLRDNWYENLEIFSDEARKAGKPFWAFALAVAHKPYPIPTLAELRLQVYSNLAYGAQGIQYFTYWTPAPGTWDFHHAPIEFETKKRTEVYDKIKLLNSEVKNLSPVFLNARVVSVGHTGADIPVGTNRLTKLPDVVKMFEVEGSAVVSVLQKENQSFLVIVNRDLKSNLTVNVEGDPKLKRVLKDGTSIAADKYATRLSVDPGDVIIYSW